MDLILWRHAEAEDGPPDLERRLTPRGRKDAAHVAKWLLQRLPSKFVVLASPALRAQETAQALGVPVRTVPG
ncbi:MAG: SixA phosphatase family protein, partial [Burkholderiales bacterium]